jgi:hypothetical protein
VNGNFALGGNDCYSNDMCVQLAAHLCFCLFSSYYRFTAGGCWTS